MTSLTTALGQASSRWNSFIPNRHASEGECGEQPESEETEQEAVVYKLDMHGYLSSCSRVILEV